MTAVIAIPLLPLAASAAIALGGPWLKGRSHLVALPAVFGAFALSVAALVRVVSSGPVHAPLYEWIDAGTFSVRLGLFVDRLTVVMLVTVTAVAGLVQAYSVRYMQGDGGYARFFACVSLFTGSMLMLVMSDNLLMMFVFWEAVGLCSFLLIGFTYERKAAGDAAVKAFWVNRIGDAGFLMAILLAWATFGTLDSQAIVREAGRHAGDSFAILGPYGSVNTLTLLTLLFLCGAFAKSAQFPLHVWLPNAMEAPTPVSALIHAATMVTAGVFLVARFSPLFDLAPLTRNVLVVAGASSALFGAAVSTVQADIKRVLAYSTMSQLGYMMLACGLGAYGLAIFHLVAHAAFKSLLFLTAGTAIEEVDARGDIPGPVPGAGWFPARFWLLWGSAVALAAMPPLVLIAVGRGVFPLASPSEHGHPVFWALTWAAALMTVVYLLRLVRAAERRSGPDATPLRLLTPRAFGYLAGAVVLVTLASVWSPLAGWAWFERFMVSVLPAPKREAPVPPGAGTLLLAFAAAAGVTLAAAAFGALHAALRRRSPAATGPWGRWGEMLYVAVLNRGYVDEVYQALVVRPVLGVANWLSESVDAGIIDRAFEGLSGVLDVVGRWLSDSVDTAVIDRAFEGFSAALEGFGKWLASGIEVGGIDRAVDAFGVSMAGVGDWFRRAQGGQFHRHAIAVLLGAVLLLGVLLAAGLDRRTP
jgi:NADH-quinone oxidoreductase subunit L